MMAFPRAVINCLLKSDVLAAAKKVERAKRGRGVSTVKYERADHGPRTCQTKPISPRPACSRKRSLKLLKRPCQYHVDWIAWQTIGSRCVTRDTFALKNF